MSAPVRIPDDCPPVTLVGINGNAFVIMAACKQAAREAGWSREQIAALIAEMSSGDYDHLLRTAIRYFDVQ